MAAGWKDALMADTGAPWNIPYVEPSDLVRDYPAADEAQALAIAAGLTDAAVIRQVVQAAKDDTFSTTSTSFVDITNLEVTITPTSHTSVILVMAAVNGSHSLTGAGGGTVRIVRGTTPIQVAATAGDRRAGHVSYNVAGTDAQPNGAIMVLDAPNSSSPVTYKAQMLTNTGTAYVNRAGSDSDAGGVVRTSSQILAIEVAT